MTTAARARIRQWWRQGASVQWEDIRRLCIDHGAPNDFIYSIEILGGPAGSMSIRMRGYERPLRVVSPTGDVAMWERITYLRYLP